MPGHFKNCSACGAQNANRRNKCANCGAAFRSSSASELAEAPGSKPKEKATAKNKISELFDVSSSIQACIDDLKMFSEFNLEDLLEVEKDKLQRLLRYL